MIKKSRAFFIVALTAATLMSCTGKSKYNTFDIGNNQYIPSKYVGKDVYNAYLSTALKTLNSAITMQAENAQHIANFVDGLIENDAYGRLSKGLAEKAFVNADFDEFKFYLRGGTENPIKWYTNKGEPYVANVGGEQKQQYVTGDDFVYAIKSALNYSNMSDCYYLPAMFIKGGYEYWAYTYVIYCRDNNIEIGYDLTNPDNIAVAVTNVAKDNGNVDLSISGADLEAISTGSRLGIHAGTETYQGKEYYYIKYNLEHPAVYFDTVLTYTPFLPINENFVKSLSRGLTSFGKSADSFLYCGAYLLDRWDETTMVYKKNPNYWDAENVHIETINYSIITGSIADDFVRKEYEKGAIDAFGISQTDDSGWKKYITGPDGTGTIEDPYDERVYSREIDVVDSTFFTILNVNRRSWNRGRSNLASQAESDNGTRALQVNDVRNLLLNGVNFATYNRRYNLTGDLRDQYQMWTYVPKGFVENTDNGKDYIEYVYEAYAEKFGITVDQARELLKQGQLPTGYEENYIAQTKELAAKAYAAVVKANEQYATNIQFPIKFEYLGLAWDAKQLSWDRDWIEEFNETVNACTTNPNKISSDLPSCSNGQYPYFEIVNNEKVTEQNYTDMGEQGEYHLYVAGWGADYADPLTYLNTMHSGSGDMASYAGVDGDKVVCDYKVDNYEENANPSHEIEKYTATSMTKMDNLLEDYDALVDTGASFYDNNEERYKNFAEAEVELIFNVHILKPTYMSGQGWSITISKMAGYETPTAAYGLSSYKLKGIYSLTEAMNGADRKAAKAKFDQNKMQALAAEKDSYTIYETEWFGE